MIKAVIFDMFETLVTLFTGRIYFSENIAEDVGIDVEAFRKEWHVIEKDRSLGKYTFDEGLELVLKRLGIYSKEKLELALTDRRNCISDTFSAIPPESIQLLKELKQRNIKIGLMTNTFSDERDFIRQSELFPYFDVALISYEQGICKPDPAMYQRMIEQLGVAPDECLYVGDGGSRELYGARDAGMKALQCTWFHELAFFPHVPCPILDEFDHAEHQLDVLNFIK